MTGPAAARPDPRLVVALVRGVHGLHGAVRVEILTDRPEDRYKPGSVLYREGSDHPLTVTWSSPIADGPGASMISGLPTTAESGYPPASAFASTTTSGSKFTMQATQRCRWLREW